MIPKSILPTSWFQDHPAAHLIDVHSRGVDRMQMSKIAASEYVMHMDIKPEKGKSFVHLITTGAGEFYGPNNNADFFNEKEGTITVPEHHRTGREYQKKIDGGLTQYHSTFSKYGGVYREHHNSRKGAKSLGSIELEAYNPAMHRGELVVKLDNDIWADSLNKLASDTPVLFSMGCFLSGTLVTMSDMSQVPIQDVAVGDEVRLHTGESSKVDAIRSLSYDDIEIYTIKPTGGLPLECTPNHPFLVVRREKAFKRGRFILDGDVIDRAEWLEASEILEGDLLLTPLSRTVAHPAYATEAFARLCGYYLAEGYVLFNKDGTPSGICFTCHASDTLRERINDICREIGTRNPPVESKRRDCDQAFSINLFDADLAKTLLMLFGSGAKNKYIHPSVFQWVDGALWELLGGYHEGDGGYYTSSDVDSVRGNAYFSTSSRELAIQLQILFPMLGHPVSINNIKHVTSASANTEDGFTYEYQLWCSRVLTEALHGLSSKIPEIKGTAKTRRTRRIVGDHMLVPVSSIDVTVRSTDVFNLEVESEHHSYLANGISTHNCGVPFDICSVCGNEAKTRANYCEHLKYNKLGITKEGHQVYAINDKPHFHDISKVRVPADRIAFALAKVASNGGIDPTADDATNMYLPLSLISKVGSESEKNNAHALSKLAEIEKKILAEGLTPEESDLSLAFPDEELPEDIIKRLKEFPLEDVLGCLANHKILLPPESFAQIVTKKDKDQIPGIDNMCPAMRGAFTEAECGAPDAACSASGAISDSSYTPLSPTYWRELEDLAKDIKPSFSIEDDPVRRRITLVVIQGGPPQHKRASMFVEPTMSAESRVLSHEYAKYQISLLAGIGADKYAHRVVVHNQAKS